MTPKNERIFLDTSVLVAASVRAHQHHKRAIALVQSLRGSRSDVYVSTHSLAELFGVLTRLPITPAIVPAEAERLIKQNVLTWCNLVPLDGPDYLDAIERLAGLGEGGGVVYDALLLAAAAKADARRIYTFNLRHFERIRPDLHDRIMSP